MAQHVCMGARLKCNQAMPPGTSILVVTPDNRLMTNKVPAANIMDMVPMKNIMPFGMCKSPANPAVAAATAAAMGTLTPMPCIPVIPAPWTVGAVTVLLAGAPSLDNSAQLMCAYAGMITVDDPGQQTHDVP
jgi:hypothetical protein